VLAELSVRAEASYVSPSLVAAVHAALGEREAALDGLERAWRERSADLAWIGVHPIFDGLRAEPRFQTLMERLGLGEFASGTLVLDKPATGAEHP
jgi:hypothetical protein